MKTDHARRPAIAVVFTIVLLNMIGFGVIMPVMPQLIMEVTGDPLANAARWGGILSALYAFMQFVFSPVMGALSDRFGRRPVLLGSQLAYSLDFLLLALAPSLAILVFARLLAGAFAATFSTANACIADISSQDKRAANFGLLGAAFGLGFIVGPAIGGFVGEAYGARAPFFLVAALGFANFLVGFVLLPETLEPANRRAFSFKRANALGNFLHYRRHPAMLPLAATLLLYQLGHWTFPSVWAYFAEERFSWTPASIAASLVAVGLGAAIVQGWLTRLVVKRIGETRTATFGMLIGASACIAYAFADQGWMIYAIIPLGALAGMTIPSLQGIMSKMVPANAQGELQGAIASVSSVAMMAGPLIMTQVFAAFASPGEPIILAGVVIAPEGAPFYFPGAPFLLAAVMMLSAFAPYRLSSRPMRTADAIAGE